MQTDEMANDPNAAAMADTHARLPALEMVTTAVACARALGRYRIRLCARSWARRT